jgi:hypothetical protein
MHLKDKKNRLSLILAVTLHAVLSVFVFRLGLVLSVGFYLIAKCDKIKSHQKPICACISVIINTFRCASVLLQNAIK